MENREDFTKKRKMWEQAIRVKMDCENCTNYFLNCHNRVDDSCMGHNDIRKQDFTCNQKLDPNYDDTEEMIRKLQTRGYKVSK